MMTKEYRLGDHKIIKSGIGELGWEAHFGLAEITEGRCFIKGSILFIGPAEGREDGFLKSEFLSHIKKLPEWLETRFYCKGFDIRHCQTGKKVTRFEMLQWYSRRRTDRKGQILSSESDTHWDLRSSNKQLKPGRWRLQQYEIAVESDNQICWKSYDGLNNVSVGACIVLEDILFWESGQIKEPKMNKRQFFENLKKLPEWCQTAYYAPKLSLQEVQIEKEMQSDRKEWPGEMTGTKYPVGQKRCRDKTRSELRLRDPFVNGSAFLSQSVKKGLSYAAGWLISNVPIFIAYLGALWKKVRQWYQSKKKKRSSVNGRDD